MARSASTDLTNSMYAKNLTAVAVDGAGTPTLRVWPANAGEYAQYTFGFTYIDQSAADVASGMPLTAGR